MGVTVREKIKGSGKWYVHIHKNKKRTSRLCGTKKTAMAVAGQLRAKLALGQDAFKQAKTTPTFGEFAATWINGYVRQTLKPGTERSYRSILKIHLLPEFKPDRITDISRAMVKDFLINKRASGLSCNRVKRIQSCISSIMAMAEEDGIIAANPAIKLQKYIGAEETDIPDPYTINDLIVYLSTCLNHFRAYYPFFLLLARTGLRLGEAIALEWGDIDYNSSCIFVRRSISDGVLTTPKNKKPRRVPMSPMLVGTLKQLRIYRKNQTMKNGWGTVPDIIFISGNRTHLHPGNLSRRVHNKITEKAGIRRIRLHDFRHTYATLRLSKGDPIQNVSKALGHSSIRITIDTYMMYLPEADQDAVDELDNLGALDTIKSAKED